MVVSLPGSTQREKFGEGRVKIIFIQVKQIAGGTEISIRLLRLEHRIEILGVLGILFEAIEASEH